MLRRNSTRRASSACIIGIARPFTRYVAPRALACLKDILSKTFYKCRHAHKRHDQHHPTQGSATPDTSDAGIALDIKTGRRLSQRQVTTLPPD